MVGGTYLGPREDENVGRTEEPQHAATNSNWSIQTCFDEWLEVFKSVGHAAKDMLYGSCIKPYQDVCPNMYKTP